MPIKILGFKFGIQPYEIRNMKSWRKLTFVFLMSIIFSTILNPLFIYFDFSVIPRPFDTGVIGILVYFMVNLVYPDNY